MEKEGKDYCEAAKEWLVFDVDKLLKGWDMDGIGRMLLPVVVIVEQLVPFIHTVFVRLSSMRDIRKKKRMFMRMLFPVLTAEELCCLSKE